MSGDAVHSLPLLLHEIFVPGYPIPPPAAVVFSTPPGASAVSTSAGTLA